MQSYGIIGQTAPPWHVNQWLNVEDEQKNMQLTDYAGKVLYLYSFQSWCPGCHSHGFPTLLKVQEHFAEDEDVVFVAIQTVFEGFDQNTVQAAEQVVKKFGLTIPVGHDPGQDGKRSDIMKNYRTGGTPWVVIIDKQGVVRYNDFHIQVPQAINLINDFQQQEKN